MKKILSLLIILSLMMILTSCSNSESEEKNDYIYKSIKVIEQYLKTEHNVKVSISKKDDMCIRYEDNGKPKVFTDKNGKTYNNCYSVAGETIKDKIPFFSIIYLDERNNNNSVVLYFDCSKLNIEYDNLKDE